MYTKGHAQSIAFVDIIFVSAREADRIGPVFSWSDSGDPRPRGSGINNVRDLAGTIPSSRMYSVCAA